MKRNEISLTVISLNKNKESQLTPKSGSHFTKLNSLPTHTTSVSLNAIWKLCHLVNLKVVILITNMEYLRPESLSSVSFHLLLNPTWSK
jgi:plasmid maintenance system killer protein